MTDTGHEPAARRRVAIIGGGPMGLAAAYELAKSGAQVTLFERDDRLGGMSAHTVFDGTPIERYYHFVCAPDRTTFRYLREFGIEDRLHWRSTSMGFYYAGRLHDWGTPLALLRFPHLSLLEKLRYAAHVMRAKGVRDWRPYDRFTAREWLERWVGPKVYAVLWKSLFELKFYEMQDEISAAWLGTRIQRVALSRKNLMEESLGYLEGGSELIVQAAGEHLRRLGGSIRLGAGVERVLTTPSAGGRRVRGLMVDGQEQPFSQVVSTVPLPYVPRLVPDLPAVEMKQLQAIRNVGVVCVMLKLRRPFTRHFWVNINDPGIGIPGLVEYTNLNPLDGSHILYAPYYMPQTHPKYARDNPAFIDETLGYLRRIRPDFDPADVVARMASRYQYAQTVCSPGFYAALPPMRSAIEGLFVADTSHYYPEDRSISESMRVGAELAALAEQAARQPAAALHGQAGARPAPAP